MAFLALIDGLTQILPAKTESPPLFEEADAIYGESKYFYFLLVPFLGLLPHSDASRAETDWYRFRRRCCFYA